MDGVARDGSCTEPICTGEDDDETGRKLGIVVEVGEKEKSGTYEVGM